MTALFLIALALLCLLVAHRLGRQTHPHGFADGIVYSDTFRQLTPPLVSHRYQLVGKPDYVLRKIVGLVPVELKSKNYRGQKPLPGHRAQLLAYCLLISQIRISLYVNDPFHL